MVWYGGEGLMEVIQEVRPVPSAIRLGRTFLWMALSFYLNRLDSILQP